MTDRFDPSRAKPETVRALVEMHLGRGGDSHKLEKKLKDECRIPLRTRAEVDAEIALRVRSCIGRCFWDMNSPIEKDLTRLCAEPTSDSGPSSADAVTPPAASPAGADLILRLQIIHDICNHYASINGERQLEIWTASDLSKPYGPPGAAAAKESSDTTAAVPAGAALEPPPGKTCDWCDDSSFPRLSRNRIPEQILWVCRRCLADRGKPAPAPESHACNPGERECNCDQALELQKRIKEILNRLVLMGGRTYQVWELIGESRP
jgi:hypothetical protein